MNNIELLLFSTDPLMIEQVDQAGIDGFIIDWEDHSSANRQHPLSNFPAPDTAEDLASTTALTQRPVWCRINHSGDWTENEVELAIAHGANLILLPMVRETEEVEHFLSLVAGRVQTGILVETVEACTCAPQLATLPLDRIYVGLFDLSISRGGNEDLFTPLIDGTVEQLRNTFHKNSFGVGGLTTIDGGNPVPCLELMAHLVRLGCDFTFLRNSFKRDVAGRNIHDELRLIHTAWQQLSANQFREVENS